MNPRTQESQRELARQSEAKRKQVPQSEANVCRRQKCNLKKNLPYKLHRTPNNAQNTQHKLGVSVLVPLTQLYGEKRDQRGQFGAGESGSQSEFRICFILLARGFKKYGQRFRSTCSATFLHCKLKSVVARMATFARNLPRNKFRCCKLRQHVAQSRP